MYAGLGVTCHLHLWQNDRSLLCATAVTRGWNGHRISVYTQREENSPAAPAGIRPRNLLITSPALLPTSYPGFALRTLILAQDVDIMEMIDLWH